MEIVFAVLQLVLALALAPLLTGVVKTLKARLQSRRGPAPLQPWLDLLKYLGRESVTSQHASWIYRVAPAVCLGAYVTAAGIVPMFSAAPPLERVGDAIVLMGLFALARFAIALAAIDTASNFGAMGASRDLAISALAEPALLLGIFAVAIPAGTTDLGALTAGAPVPAIVLGFLALFIVAIAETGRIPVDNPDTHLELTMVHEGMLLEYSGRPLGLLLWASHVKQLVILSLVAALFLPVGLARDAAAASVVAGVAAWVAKVGVLGLALGVVETAYAKLRIFRVPQLLVGASLLGLVAVVSTYVIGR